jgi:hypothetical protein
MDAGDGSNETDLFAIKHLHEMLVDLKTHYYAAWPGSGAD